MSEVVRETPRVVSIVSKFVARRMPEHVRVNREG